MLNPTLLMTMNETTEPTVVVRKVLQGGIETRKFRKDTIHVAVFGRLLF